MTSDVISKKERDMESFDSVVALYSILKANMASLRVKQAIYKAGEMEAQPLDFVIDVEIKVKRAVGQMFYDLFLRAVFNENLDLLTEYMREALGRTFTEYGLGPEGTYAKLYFRIKNEQVRSFLKENNGITKFDRSTGLDAAA
jgi:hypothetical protein